MEPARISAEDLKAFWAWTECRSTRFGSAMASALPTRIMEAALSGKPFESVSDQDRHALVVALKSFRPDWFVDWIDQYGAPQFELTTWTVQQLLGCVTIPQSGALQFYRYVAMGLSPDVQTKTVSIDPRAAAASIDYDDDFRVEQPTIAILVKGRLMLLDGYLRSILWLRNPVDPLPVWVPAGTSSA